MWNNIVDLQRAKIKSIIVYKGCVVGALIPVFFMDLVKGFGLDVNH